MVPTKSPGATTRKQRYRRIILHAGLHKTGTSSIQVNCFRHRELLLQHGIYYPFFSFHGRQITNHSDPMTAALCTSGKLYAMPGRLRIRDDPRAALESFSAHFAEILGEPKADTLLLSGELVCDYTPEDLLAVRERLLQAGDELQVVAFLRSPRSSLESILQQRNRRGILENPHTLVGTISQRFGRLQEAFGDILQVHNFHTALEHPSGLVGYFLCNLGLPAASVGELAFEHANERVSLEAYRLLRAINTAYPAALKAEHGVERHFHDISPLLGLPGQPFHIQATDDPGLCQALVEEAESLERQVGFKFPQFVDGVREPPWQTPTLMALESAISRLDNKLFRAAAAEALVAEAAGLERDDPGTAAILGFIARRIGAQEDPPVALAMEQLGADYFKFAALQVECECPQMALQLMALARLLRPDGDQINEKIKLYRDRLAEECTP